MGEVWGVMLGYHFKFLEEIRLHVDFGEIIFLKWNDVINSNFWILAILKLSGLPLFKLLFFLKLNT